MKPSDNMLRKEYAQLTRLQRAVNADVASLHGNGRSSFKLFQLRHRLSCALLAKPIDYVKRARSPFIPPVLVVDAKDQLRDRVSRTAQSGNSAEKKKSQFADERLETAKALLSWIDRDNYGFFNDLGSEAAKVLDRDGLAAFEIEVHHRFERAIDNRSDPSGRHSGLYTNSRPYRTVLILTQKAPGPDEVSSFREFTKYK